LTRLLKIRSDLPVVPIGHTRARRSALALQGKSAAVAARDIVRRIGFEQVARVIGATCDRTDSRPIFSLTTLLEMIAFFTAEADLRVFFAMYRTW
jgi:hypothetical protein